MQHPKIEKLVRQVDAIRANPDLTPEQKATLIKQVEAEIRSLRPAPTKHTGKGSFGTRRQRP